MRRIVAEGHTLCNHTWDHDFQLADRTPEQIVKDMVRTNDAIHTVVPNAKVRYFRNPGGNFNHRTVSVAQHLGMVPLHWSIDSRDWESKNARRSTTWSRRTRTRARSCCCTTAAATGARR